MMGRGSFSVAFIIPGLILLIPFLQMCLRGAKDTGAQGQQLGSVVDELDQSSLGQQAPLHWWNFLHCSWAWNQALAQLQRKGG